MKTSSFLKEAADSVADLVSPRNCIACGRDLYSVEDELCIPCLCDFPLTRYERISRNPMADKLNSFVEKGPYLYATALFFHLNGYSSITPAIKYRRNFAAGRYFSSMLGEKILESEYLRDVDCIVPVPLHPFRKFKRGYNQAEIIAREVGKMLPQAEVRCDLLRKRKSSSSQVKLNREQRYLNIKDAFAATAKCRDAHYSHILLVDDVFTTGSTLAACCNALKKALPNGSARISVATLSFDEQM